jgi:hypothetical protein
MTAETPRRRVSKNDDEKDRQLQPAILITSRVTGEKLPLRLGVSAVTIFYDSTMGNRWFPRSSK